MDTQNSDFHDYLLAQGLMPQTALSYASLAGHFIRVSFVPTADSAANFYRTLPSASTKRIYYFAFRRYSGFLGINLVEKISPPKQTERLPHFLNKQQIKKILEYKPKNESRKRNKALAVFLLATGVRISEALAVKTAHIGEDGRLTILGKGGKERQIYIDPSAMGIIKEYIESRRIPSEWLFARPQGESIPRTEAQVFIRNFSWRLGIKFSAHTFRHTFATMMCQSGCDIKTIQGLLGHESLRTTEIYLHFNSDTVRKNYEAHNPMKIMCEKGLDIDSQISSNH